MRIDHLAIWVEDLEKMKEFYTNYFDFTATEKYINPLTGFSSYFLELSISKARIELMHKATITEDFKNRNSHLGLAHFAIGLGSEDIVYSMTEQLRKDGVTIAGEPRFTGDGYLESMILDPEGNVVELTV